jgi:hypothetical protein
MDSLVPIEGSAILIEDDVKGVRNELIMAIANTTLLLTADVPGLVIALFINKKP